MLAENVLVSTLTPEEVFGLADEVLSALGFSSAGAAGGATDPGQEERWREWTRGRPKVKYYVRLSELPQRFRVEFDRGRVTITAQVQERGRERPKLHEAMLLSLVSAVTLRIEGRDLADATSATVVAQSDIERVYRRQRMFRWTLFAFLGLIVALIAAAIIAAIVAK